MRTARQQNEFACTTSLGLAIYLVNKNQEQLRTTMMVMKKMLPSQNKFLAQIHAS
jgi:hypothetical protein